MQFGLGGFSRGIRGSKKQVKKAASKGALHFLIFALVTQLVLPTQHMAFAAPGDENKPNPEENAPREDGQQADPRDIIPPVPYDVEGTSSTAMAPELRELIRENQQGRVRPADPNGVSEQVLEIVDNPGRVARMYRWAVRQQVVRPTRTIDLKDSNIARPVVSIADFGSQVEVFYEAPSNKLVMSALGGSVRHVRLNANLVAAPITDPEMVLAVKTRGQETASTSNYQLDLLPVDEFMGDGKAKGFGFYAPANFYPVLNFSLPRNARIKSIEFYGPQSDAVSETLSGDKMPGVIRTGDLVFTLEQDGKTIRRWLSRDSLYLNLKQCIKHTAVLAFIRNPTAEAHAQLLELFDGEAEELAALRDDLQNQVDADGNWMIDRALSAQRMRNGNTWQVQNARRLPAKDKNGNPVLGRSVLENMAARPRQEHRISEPDGEWEVLRQRLDEAQKVDPNIKFSATTTSFAQTAIAAAVKQDKKIQAARWGFWKKFQAAKKKILTPGKMILLGLTLSAAGFVAAPDSAPYEYLTAMGSRVYEYAAQAGKPGAGWGPEAVNAVTSPLNNASTFLSNQYFSGPEGMWNIAAWGTTLAFYVSFLPMFYLASYAYHRFQKGESVRVAWWPMSQLVFTDMLSVFAWINRAVQEGFWNSPMARQYNLYNALNAGKDPLDLVNNRKAWNAPWASQEKIDANARALSQNLDKDRQIRMIASRAMALAIVAKETGVDPGTLEMSGSAGDMTQFLKQLMEDGDTSRKWYLTTTKLYELLDAVANEKPEMLSLDPEQTNAMVAEYMGQAKRILDTAELLDHEDYFEKVCETDKSKAPQTDCKKFSVTGFLGSLAKRSAAAVSQNVLHWAFFGMPGVRVFHNNRGRTVDMNATRLAGTMVGVDYPISTLAWASKSPEAFMLSAAPPFFGETRVLAGQAEQVIGWHAGTQVDAMSNSLKMAKQNPYAPLASFYFDPDMGGPHVREQTLDEGLAAILRSRTDPNSKSWFGYWQNYLLNVYRFFQAKLILSGVPLAAAWFIGGESKDLLGAPNWIAIPTLAAFTAAWLWLIKYTVVATPTETGMTIVPNYAVLWSGVAMGSNDASEPVGGNREAIMGAIAYLSSSEPSHYQRGVKELKALFAKHHLPIPERFNRPSNQFDAQLKDAFHSWIKETDSVPGPNKDGTLLTLVILNLGLGALGTTALYDSLSKSLNAGDATPILSAGHALGWYVAALGGAAGLGYVAKLSAPLWKYPHLVTDKAITAVAGARDAAKRACGELLSGLGSEPMTYEINLE